MTPKSLRFDTQLLRHIELFENDEAKSMLTQDLCNAIDDLGSLLHYAASHGNATFAHHLIELGSEVDILEKNHGRTPLMTAVENKQPDVVEVLLEANANIYVDDDENISALEMAISWKFECSYVDIQILVSFLRRVQSDAIHVEDSIDRLLEAGCTMYHFAFFNDIPVMNELIKRGFDIDHQGPRRMTALHAAVEIESLNLVKWLVDEFGANVNAVNVDGNGPLFFAALRGKVDVLRFLLERGADPNTIGEYSPLFVAFSASRSNTEGKFDECVELLLRYGAVPRNSSEDRFTMLDYALFTRSRNKIDMLIGQLAILEMRGDTSIVKSVMRIKDDWHKEAAFTDLEKNYEMCKKILVIRVFEKLTLFDLLTMRESKLMVYARNELFVPKVMDISCERELNALQPYYCKYLMQRISSAIRTRSLENMAISAICDIFHVSYSEYYIFARRMVGYLRECDLELLCDVPNGRRDRQTVSMS